MNTQETFRLLVLEDSPNDLRILKDLLRDARRVSLEMEHAETLAGAIRLFGERHFDCVLLDLMVPDSRGLDTFREFQRETHGAGAVIIMSGLSSEDVAANAVAAGAQDYLVKGQVTSDLLVRSIRYAIARHHAEEALRESEERYALAVRGANDGVWDWNMIDNSIYFSPRWKAILGYEDDEIPNHPREWFSRVHPHDLHQVREHLQAHLNGATPHFQSEHRLMHKDGVYRWALVRGLAVRNTKEQATRMAGSLTDVTKRKSVEEQLLHDALHDTLTGLPNRALFMDHLRLSLERARRRRYYFAVLFLDLDQFKVVNDSLGHVIGDQLLGEIAERLKSCIRPGDTLARLGGDEFTILLDDINSISSAHRVAQRIQDEMARPIIVEGHEVFTSASIGIALSASCYERPEEVLRDADTAMYRAKSRGRARYEVFDQNMHKRALDLLELETTLRHAVKRDEFLLHYQPIVNLASGKLCGFEALVRWEHPRRGLIGPDDFIPLAEDTGLIIPIGRWVMEQACKQLEQWTERYPGQPPLAVSVNLSSRQIMQPDFVTEVNNIIKNTKINPKSLRLEITESMIMDNAQDAIDLLWRLKKLNLHLNIDDFGTGYSSLSYLHRFPIDTFKIDRSFVSNMDKAAENYEIVRTILSLASNLGMEVTAEGVETVKQFNALKQLRCNLGQGFYFSRPIVPAEAEEMLKRGPVWA